MSRHATLGASSAYRWMKCPGSIKLTSNIPRQQSIWAIEGTTAHALAEKVLRGELLLPHEIVGQEIDGIPVTDEMANAVMEYCRFVDQLANHPESVIQLEVEVSLRKLGFDNYGEMFGTADCVVTYPDPADPKRLVVNVVDYKHGAGVPVSALDNPQLLYYGLGVLYGLMGRRRDLKKFLDDEQVELRLCIVQPRSPEARVSQWIVASEVMLQFERDLLAAAKTVLREPNRTVAGDHCRFCPAKDICPSHVNTAMTVWGKGMDNLVHDPMSMPAEALSEALQQCVQLDKAITAFRRIAQIRMEDGEPIPGWKLEPTRPTRIWADESLVKSRWLELYGNTHDLYLDKILTVAQLQKQLGDDFEKFEDLIESRSSGVKLAQDMDNSLGLLPNLN